MGNCVGKTMEKNVEKQKAGGQEIKLPQKAQQSSVGQSFQQAKPLLNQNKISIPSNHGSELLKQTNPEVIKTHEFNQTKNGRWENEKKTLPQQVSQLIRKSKSGLILLKSSEPNYQGENIPLDQQQQVSSELVGNFRNLPMNVNLAIGVK